MSIVSDVITLAANNDIVELHAHQRLYWTTRRRFDDLVEVSNLIESAISNGATLTTLQHIFDEPETMREIQSRYRSWVSGKDPSCRTCKSGAAKSSRTAKPHPRS